MSIDLEMILACAPAIAQEALREGASVTKIGPRASRVRTHFRFPASATSGEWREIARYARAIARSVGHEDPRGVLVVPEALEVDVRSYDRFVERTGNQGYFWLKVQDLEALREALDGSRDEAYLGAYERGAR